MVTFGQWIRRDSDGRTVLRLLRRRFRNENTIIIFGEVHGLVARNNKKYIHSILYDNPQDET